MGLKIKKKAEGALHNNAHKRTHFVPIMKKKKLTCETIRDINFALKSGAKQHPNHAVLRLFRHPIVVINYAQKN